MMTTMIMVMTVMAAATGGFCLGRIYERSGMTFEIGYKGDVCVVYPTSYEAEQYEWFWWGILRRPNTCFDGYENAYILFTLPRSWYAS